MAYAIYDLLWRVFTTCNGQVVGAQAQVMLTVFSPLQPSKSTGAGVGREAHGAAPKVPEAATKENQG
jgi:hypothetical protein